MGDPQVCCGRLPNGGVVPEDHLGASAFLQPLAASNPDPSSITDDSWTVAEEFTQQIIRCIHPTLDSEEKRKDVIDYVQGLLRCSVGCEVFPYGSVPLKTYLPDGDIDLTALSTPNVEETLARCVLAVLQGEELNENAVYGVKDTQFIDAEVKLVKCLVQNIVIDISFNQLGGLCTLCFFEQVDRRVGKDHLFKRSIILIKAWCYYESRILGAHHGLISTYALETLVLYIFHLFHSSLNGPLAVLYRFLDYFSKFDWDNYCVSLNGPVCKSSLPEIVVEMPENIGGNLMFDENFLKNCTEVFSVPSRCSETDLRAFPQKHLNIFDPLKENNNLGRSVHRGNFYRIRSAFKYGARKLGRILLLPRERVGDEIKRFFANTLERHGCKYRAYTQTSALAFDAEGSCSLSSISHAETFFEDEIRIKSINIDSDNDISESERYCNSGDGLERCLMRADSSQMVSELKDGTAISGSCLGGDANDHASSRLVNLRGPHGTFDSSPSSGSNHCSSQSGHYNHALKCYTSRACVENGRLDNGNFSPRKHGESYDDNMGYDSWVENWKNNSLPTNTTRDCDNNHDDLSCCASEFSSPDADILECSSLDFREGSSVGIVEDTETLNPLSDLSGDYDSHLRSLLYGQVCHGYALSAPVLSNPPAPHSQVPKQTPWGIVRMSMPLKQTSSLDMNSNGLVLVPPVNPAANSRAIGAAFGLKEKYESLGTGTFIPNANGCLCKEKPSQGRSRKKAPGNRSQRQTHAQNSGADHALAEKNKIEEGCSESPRARSSGHGKAELSHQSHDNVEGIGHANGFSDSGWRLEFGSLGSLTSWGQFASGSSHLWGSRPGLAAAEVEHPKPLPLKRQERVVEQSYSLKNEDFPPLSH